MDRRDRLAGLFLLIPLLVGCVGTWASYRLVAAPIARLQGISDLNAVPYDRAGTAIVLLCVLIVFFCIFVFVGYIATILICRGRYSSAELWEAMKSPSGKPWAEKYVKRQLLHYEEKK